MQTNLESLGTLERRLHFVVPLEQIESEVETRLQRLARTVKMQGFRPGKVPVKVVAQQYGGQIRQETLGDAVQKNFTEAVKAHQLKVVGYPRIEPKKNEGGGEFEFSATFEVYPEVNVGDLSETVIERPEVDISEADVDKTIDILRKQRVTYSPVERAAQMGDQVDIDFRGAIGGEEFPGGKGEGYKLALGAGQWLKDFEAPLVGMTASETKTFDLIFPADYHAQELAGKTATFEVTLNKAAEPKLPEVDAEFAKSLGVASGDLGAMRGEVRDNVEREVKKRIQSRMKDQAMRVLMDASPLELPKALVEMEAQRLAHQAEEDLKARGVSTPDAPFNPAVVEGEAKRRVHLGLVLADLVEKHALQVKSEQVRSRVEEHAQSFEQPEELVKWIYSQPERLSEVESLVLEDNVMDWVLQQAKVLAKTIAFDELMGNGK